MTLVAVEGGLAWGGRPTPAARLHRDAPDPAPGPSAQTSGSTGPTAPTGAESAPTSASAHALPPLSSSLSPSLMRDDVIVLLLARMRAGARLWGWSRIVQRDRPLRGLNGLRFGKALGSGYEGGFGLKPSLDHQGLFLVFDGQDAAQDFLADSALLRAYQDHAAELLSIQMRATSCRGSWDGQSVGVSADLPADGAVAALTRASIRPLKAARFWRHAPPSEVALAQAQGCRLAVGLGEAPVLRQATISLWDSVAAMDAYARSGAHLAAIRAAYAQDFFTETMFVRFHVLALRGCWKGVRHG